MYGDAISGALEPLNLPPVGQLSICRQLYVLHTSPYMYTVHRSELLLLGTRGFASYDRDIDLHYASVCTGQLMALSIGTVDRCTVYIEGLVCNTYSCRHIDSCPTRLAADLKAPELPILHLHTYLLSSPHHIINNNSIRQCIPEHHSSPMTKSPKG